MNILESIRNKFSLTRIADYFATPIDFHFSLDQAQHCFLLDFNQEDGLGSKKVRYHDVSFSNISCAISVSKSM